eukprot:GFKZ01012789.1.p1 GENE.GFKZ01012789.1~~GFKZ01012789.1.p1  ORF type:complete len:1018 (-),score=153.14 GFKZ01012789.1:708-3761(-)
MSSSSSNPSNPSLNTPTTPTTSNSIPTSIPTSTPNRSVPNTPRTLDSLFAEFPLSSSTISLARSILTSIPTPHDSSTPIQALYLALLSSLPPDTPSLSSLLSSVNPPLNLPHFLYRLKILTSDLTPLPPSLSFLSTSISHLHHSFTLSSHTYHKLQLLLPHLRLAPPSQLPWLLYLVSKSNLPAEHPPLTPLSSFHLLLASLLESHYLPSSFSLTSFPSLPNPVQSELSRFRSLFRNSLPPAVSSLLPLHTTPDLSLLLPALHHHYSLHLNTSPKTRLPPDERLFLSLPPNTLPHLAIQSTPHSRLHPDSVITPNPSPRKRKLSALDNPVQTPRTRSRVHLLSERMALTPKQGRFSNYLTSFRGADALDALAAVASSTPHSPIQPSRKSIAVPATPVSAACRAVAWLQRLANARPETLDEFAWWKDGEKGVSSTQAMRAVVKEEAVWEEVVLFVKETAKKVEERMPEMGGKERGREAAAVFFAAFEDILVRETDRLKNHPKWILDNLMRAKSVRKSLMVCAWEATAAAYGRKDLLMFSSMLDLLEVPPLDIVKSVEPFVRLKDMPHALSEHLVVCGNHVLDSMAWRPDSKLVAALRQRAWEMRLERTRSALPVSSGGPPASTRPNNETGENRPSKNATREFTLEFFFIKLLSIASERAQELLFKLGMDVIADPVWKSIKYALWEKWHMMVGRHVDQVVMCCVYGVAKVRRHELKFRQIIDAYQSLTHVREPSFANLVPGVYRDVSLDPHLNLLPPDGDNSQRSTRSVETRHARGDIIKLYNQVFIHAMKMFILNFQVPPTSSNIAAHQTVPRGGSLGTSGRNSSISRLMRTSKSTNTESSRQLSDRDEGNNGDVNDVLRQKVMSSPMRVRRPFASPKRFGRVTVSPMSSGGQSLMRLRQSPGLRAMGPVMGGMTPGTRKLYAFGESPVRNSNNKNRTLADSSGSEARRMKKPVLLNFEADGVSQRSALIRRRLADALGKNPSLRSPSSNPGLVSSSEGSASAGSGSDVVSKSNGVDT